MPTETPHTPQLARNLPKTPRGDEHPTGHKLPDLGLAADGAKIDEGIIFAHRQGVGVSASETGEAGSEEGSEGGEGKEEHLHRSPASQEGEGGWI